MLTTMHLVAPCHMPYIMEYGLEIFITLDGPDAVTVLDACQYDRNNNLPLLETHGKVPR